MNHPNYRADIQVLRALSILGVLAFHLSPNGIPGGFLGVDVFFVISGYLITRIIMRSLQGSSFSFLVFYSRRINRLLPALLIVIFCVLVFGVIGLPPAEFESLFEHLPWASLQLSNFSFMKTPDYFGAEHSQNPILHTWSLGVEEQFYLVWAPFLFLIYMFSRNRKESFPRFTAFSLVAVGFISILGSSLLATKLNEDISFFSPLGRASQFALGSILSCFKIDRNDNSIFKNSISLIGYLLIILSFIFLNPGSGFTWMACVGAFLAIAFPFSLNSISGKLTVPLQYLGNISYSLYLWHWPVICFFPYFTGRFEITTVDCIVMSALALGLAMLSFHFVETPGRRTSQGDMWFLKPCLLILGLFAVGGGAYALQTEETASWRFQRITPTADLGSGTMKRGFPLDLNKPFTPTQLPFNRSTKGTSLLIGDSHAEHYYPVVQKWCDENSEDLVICYTSGFLSVGRSTMIRRYRKDGRTVTFDYSRYADHLYNELVANRTIKRVFIGHRTAWYVSKPTPLESQTLVRSELKSSVYPDQDSKAIFEKELSSFVEGVVKSGKSVVLLGQVPPLRAKPKQGPTLIEHWIHGTMSEPDLSLGLPELRRLDFERDLYEQLSKIPGVHHFRASKYLTHYRDKNGASLYEDENHLNQYGSLYLGQFFDFSHAGFEKHNRNRDVLR